MDAGKTGPNTPGVDAGNTGSNPPSVDVRTTQPTTTKKVVIIEDSGSNTVVTN